jgi:undecaprenyl diphosphate synthase
MDTVNTSVAQAVNIPAHIAVIPDGNRRWAKEKGLPSLMGHKKGAENFEHLLNTAREMGISYVSIWSFSTENWKRSEEEVSYLFELLRDFVKKYKDKALREKIRFIHLGRKDRLPADVVETLKEMEEKTKDYTEFTFALAMDYGGHDEMLRALNKIISEGKEINTENLDHALDTAKMPYPDLIIRTGGEQRLSGFMPWQSEYAELAFPKMYFPDFDQKALREVIENFSNRERRFGGDSIQK